MLTTALTAISLPEATGLSLLGIAVVFSILVVLMLVIALLSRLSDSKKSNKRDLGSNLPEQASTPVQTATKYNAPVQIESAQANQQATANSAFAQGSAGEIKLNNVPDKQAAMVIAVVADHLKTPLNQLRFKSIKRLD